MTVCTTVTLHANRADGGKQHDRALPDIAVETCRSEFFARNGDGLAQHRQAFGRNFADDPYRKARAEKWLPPPVIPAA
ncbi:MAG TPA: hypothetical protein VIJ31_17360 [Acidothermaceae bacterium]